MTDYILFDLDGTLLPMDMEQFVKAYFKLLAAKAAPLGYDPKQLYDAIWAGVGAVVQNDGSCINKDVFWRCFADIFGNRVYSDQKMFDDFYANEFNMAKDSCGFNEDAAKTISLCKSLGKKVVLATNPIFPGIATENRARWAGIDAKDFELITTYENCNYCKPNLEYYRLILDRLGISGDRCAMVGNDVQEDMPAEALGMKVFLLTDCIINRDGTDISRYPNGGFPELMDWIRQL
ncbi:MAG: HAD family hydrolase [Lachnospiraceae bacterium]|jgi:FMN phosphatase YigB (HAD superfamily)